MGFGVKNTRREAPVRLVVYGPGGIGKSSLASQAPSPIFIAAEEGLENLDAVAVEPYPRTWEEALAAIDYVSTLDHKTLAIDSLDWLEPLVWAYVVRRAGKPSIKDIEGFGYGKGYIAALEQWRILIHKLSTLRAKGMNVVLIAHGIRKTFRNPMGDDFDHWAVKLHEKAAGLIVEWVDVVGFLSQDVSTAEDEASKRTKALTSGKRVLRCNPDPTYLAKTRFALPRQLVIPRDGAWEAFASACRAGSAAALDALRATFEAKVIELGNADVEKGARDFLASSGVSVASVSEAIATLDSYLAERKAS